MEREFLMDYKYDLEIEANKVLQISETSFLLVSRKGEYQLVELKEEAKTLAYSKTSLF